MEYNSWHVSFVSPRNEDLDGELLFLLDIDLKRHKHTRDRQGRLISIKFQPFLPINEGASINEYADMIILKRLEKDFEELEKRQRKMISDLDAVNIDAVQLHQKIQSYKNKIK